MVPLCLSGERHGHSRIGLAFHRLHGAALYQRRGLLSTHGPHLCGYDMSPPIIEVHEISKRFRLGAIDAGSFREELDRVWERLRGRKPPKTPSGREFWALRDVSFEVQP